MRIGIAAVLGTCGGPRTYARALVEALARADSDHEYWVLTDRPEAVPRARQVRAVHVPLASRYAQPWWDHVGVPSAVRALGLDLLHHTKAALPLGLRVPSVVSVYDAAPFLHARTFTPLQALHHRHHIRHAARRAGRLVTISEEARAELADALDLDRERIVVVPPGSIDGAAPRRAGAAAEAARAARALFARLGIDGPYALALGTVQPRKDLRTVVEAYARFRGRTGTRLQLVIAGRDGWRDGEAGRCDSRCGPSGTTRAVVRTGVLSDDEVEILVAHARLAVNASLYEGFGLAVLEAMAHGVPLVSTPVPALSGATDGAYLRVAVGDVGGLSCAIERLARDPALRLALGARGRGHAARFSWDDTARATLAVYREVARG